jgi:ribosomal protein S6|tara:strand:+ start:305 stop:493 length:189 start_codon:yes stop_codon:yes gene_type:complete
MRYKYTITKEGGETEEMEEMGWKKLFKKLLEKYPKFSGWCSYFNKHGNMQVRAFMNGKETRK